MSRWTEADIPQQAGQTALVTGANSGLGLQTAMVLAGRGATVLPAARLLWERTAQLTGVTPDPA